MSRGTELAELRLRKRALVLESDLHRLALRREWGELCAGFDWVREAGGYWHEAKKWAVVLAALAGLLAARGAAGASSRLGRFLSVFRWARSLYGLWRRLSSGSTPLPQGRG